MRHPGIDKKKSFSLISFFHLTIGISGIVFFVTIDFFKASIPNFGINQLAGFAISTIIALSGLRKFGVLKERLWDSFLLMAYLAGILFMGLRFKYNVLETSNNMLLDLSFSYLDVVINILGFFILGYLMISYFLSSDRKLKKGTLPFLSIVICIGISFFIEVSQYYIPGRSSSLLDILYNGIGAFGGVIYFLLEKKTLSQ